MLIQSDHFNLHYWCQSQRSTGKILLLLHQSPVMFSIKLTFCWENRRFHLQAFFFLHQCYFTSSCLLPSPFLFLSPPSVRLLHLHTWGCTTCSLEMTYSSFPSVVAAGKGCGLAGYIFRQTFTREICSPFCP